MAESGEPDPDGRWMSRRTLIRLLVGLGIGIPILIEAGTLIGLIRNQLGLDSTDPTTTTGPTGATVGDAVLPETAADETLVDAAVLASEPNWTVRLGISVENLGDSPYELRLSTLTLDDGTTVEGTASTGPIPAGETGEVTGAWSVPRGTSPRTLAVRVMVGDSTEHLEIRLGHIPVQG